MLIDKTSGTKRAKVVIKFVAGMTVFAGMALGLIVGNSGHGPTDIPFVIVSMSIGGLLSSPFAYIHVLAARKLEQQDRASSIYVYIWCAIMIAVGMVGLFGMITSPEKNNAGLMGLALLLTAPGVIAGYVLLVKRAIHTTKIDV